MLNSDQDWLNAEVAERDAESAEVDVEQGRGIDSSLPTWQNKLVFTAF